MSSGLISEALGTLGTTTSSSSSSSSSSSTLDKSDFLTLLTTQLQNQDPTNPMDDKDMVAELAQFSTLEGIQNMSDSIDSLSSTVATQTVISAVNYLGKNISASGDEISKSDGTVSTLTYTLDSQANSVTINVLNSDSEIVRTVTLGAKDAGTYDWTWDGKDDNGNACVDGQYTIGFSALDSDGNTVSVTTSTSGKVTGLKNDGSGFVFVLEDGREVQFEDITKVVSDASTSDSSSTSSSS